MTIELRVAGGAWKSISENQARGWIAGSWFVHDYDQIKTDPDSLAILDLAIPAFLDAVPSFKRMRRAFRDGQPASLDETIDDLGKAVRSIPSDKDLWEIDQEVLRPSLLALFGLATKIAGFGPAVASKMLHRKRPRVIPVIDSFAEDAWASDIRKMRRAERMAEICVRMGAELGARGESRHALREIASDLGDRYAELSDLRLYDVISYNFAYEARSRSGEGVVV